MGELAVIGSINRLLRALLERSGPDLRIGTGQVGVLPGNAQIPEGISSLCLLLLLIHRSVKAGIIALAA